MYEIITDKKIKAILFCCFLLMIIAPTVMFFRGVETWYQWLTAIILFFGFAYFFFCIYMSYCKDVKFDKEKVYIRYPFGKWIAYAWDDFQEVGLYFISIKHQQRTPDRPALFFICKGVKKRRVMGGWPLNNFLRYKKVINVRYSEAVFSALKERCPYSIYETTGIDRNTRYLY